MDIAAHVAALKESIAAIEECATVDVDRAHYLALHRYALTLLELLADSYAVNEAALGAIVQSLLRPPEKRPAGRPKMMTLKSLGKAPAPPRPVGRPTVIGRPFLAMLSARVDHAMQAGAHKTLRAGLAAALREYAEETMPAGKARERRIEELAKLWYRPLSAHRRREGKGIREVSEKPPQNTPDFLPLSRYWPSQESPYVQQPRKSGKEIRSDANPLPPARRTGAHGEKP